MALFEEKLQRYADLVVRVGLNLRAGQHLLVRAPVETAPLVRAVTASAYKAGARYVEVWWRDDALTLARFQHAPRDSFEEFPFWQSEALTKMARRGDAVLSIAADDPDLLKDQDPELVSTAMKVLQLNMQGLRQYTMRDAINWAVVSAPIPSWAARVFPAEPADKQVDCLWETIFQVCRMNEADPVAAWQAHINRLVARSDYLNAKQYTALKYSGPGTDLTLGLPAGHVWNGAQTVSDAGISFTPNLPTEEIFTLPHKDRVDGVVSSSLPLNYSGTLIEDFRLTFAGGRVVKATAAKGEAALLRLLETDEGAARLGEAALVPHSSPISQSGLLFYNTLFDENAASHLALGNGYSPCLSGGAKMSAEELAAAGYNRSLIHEDFMIGNAALNVDGVTAQGALEPVMRNGEWAFEI